MRIEVELDTRAAVELFSDMGNRLEQPSSLLSTLGEELVEIESRLFASGGDGQWAPLAEGTVMRKGSGRTLVDKGDLLAGLTSQSSIQTEDDSVSITTSHPAAKYLAGGTSRMPRRDPAPEPSGADVNELADVMLRAITRGRR